MNMYDLVRELEAEILDNVIAGYSPSDLGQNAGLRSYITDMVMELADSSVPVYNSTLLDLANDNLYLATEEPECGPAYDGSATAVNVIAANVYETLVRAGCEYLDELEQDIDSYGCLDHDEWLISGICPSCDEEEDEVENVSVTSTKSSAIGWSPAEEFFGNSIKVSRNTKPKCKTCEEFTKRGVGPSHDASARCQSGGRNHCTCDTCF